MSENGQHFDFDAQGWAYCAITERAMEFAGGNPNKLAELCFAQFLNERGIDLDWRGDHEEQPRFVVGCWQIGLSIKNGVQNANELPFEPSGSPTTLAAVLQLDSTTTPLCFLLGMKSYVGEPAPFRAQDVCTMSEWLLAFRQYHVVREPVVRPIP